MTTLRELLAQDGMNGEVLKDAFTDLFDVAPYPYYSQHDASPYNSTVVDVEFITGNVVVSYTNGNYTDKVLVFPEYIFDAPDWRIAAKWWELTNRHKQAVDECERWQGRAQRAATARMQAETALEEHRFTHGVPPGQEVAE